MRRRERHKRIICPNCHYMTVCVNRFESVYKLLAGYYVRSVCPRRKGEGRYGNTVLFEVLRRLSALNLLVTLLSQKGPTNNSTP